MGGLAAPAQGRTSQAQRADCGVGVDADRDGGVLWDALSDARVRAARAHGAADGAQVGHDVPDEGQARHERRGRHGGDLRGALEQMSIPLSEVLRDAMGSTGRPIVPAIVAGERDPKVLAGHRHSRVKRS